MNNPLKNDYILSITAKLSMAIIGVISSAFCTRYLGVEYKGEYTFIQQAVSVIALILNLGFYQSYAFNFRKYGETVYKKYISLFFAQFIVYCTLAVIIAAVSRNLQIALIVILAPVQILRIQMDNIMLVQNIRIKLIANIINSVVTAACYGVFWVLLPASVFPVVMTVFCADLLIVAIYLIKEKTRLTLKYFDAEFSKSVLKFGIVPMLASLLVTLNYSVDIFFLRRMGEPIELSYYSLAAGIMNYVWLIPDAFKDVVFSRVAREEKSASIPFAIKCSIIILIAMVVGFSLFGKVFITIMYDVEFVNAYSVTMILFLGVFSMVLFKVLGIVLIAEGKRIPYFLLLLVSVICNVVMNLNLIPTYGMYGAAVASVISYNMCGLMFLFYYAHAHHVNPFVFIIPTRSDFKLLSKLIKRGR